MNHEIYRGSELLCELKWEWPPWDGSPESERRRDMLTERAIATAFELRGLAFERRHPNWLESDHRVFECAEIESTIVRVRTPIGYFRTAAKRAKAGDICLTGGIRTEDQQSLPTVLYGRLCVPTRYLGWQFQPSHFCYADGTASQFLGSYPQDIVWEQEPEWTGSGESA